MKKLLDNITAEVTKAFVEAGYEEKFGKVTLSNRPDLCEFQCNGAMAAAKQYKKAPFMIADDVAAPSAAAMIFLTLVFSFPYCALTKCMATKPHSSSGSLM